jgi:hypothetical protein
MPGLSFSKESLALFRTFAASANKSGVKVRLAQDQLPGQGAKRDPDDGERDKQPHSQHLDDLKQQRHESDLHTFEADPDDGESAEGRLDHDPDHAEGEHLLRQFLSAQGLSPEQCDKACALSGHRMATQSDEMIGGPGTFSGMPERGGGMAGDSKLPGSHIGQAYGFGPYSNEIYLRKAQGRGLARSCDKHKLATDSKASISEKARITRVAIDTAINATSADFLEFMPNAAKIGFV